MSDDTLHTDSPSIPDLPDLPDPREVDLLGSTDPLLQVPSIGSEQEPETPEESASALAPHVEFALEALNEELEDDPDVQPVSIEEALEELEQDDLSGDTGPLPAPLELELAQIKQAQAAAQALAIQPPKTDTASAGAPVEPMSAPGRETVPVASRTDSDTFTGQNEFLRWGARSDVGLVRSHNEDSLFVEAPLFCVCDGMGGHAAGEVASSIAVRSIAENSPRVADDVLLGVAIEKANLAVIDAVERGEGRAGMGCTATAAVIQGNRMSVAHVGDSRIYILHHGSLVRVTRDHSFVEELVDSGEITVGEARLHPSRSIITRALGSDPDMYADHFTLDIEVGDRIIICSDGLSSMVSDSHIESIAVSNVTPQGAVDSLVAEALTQGGHDNITAIAIDVLDDGVLREHRRQIARRVLQGVIIVAMLVAMLIGIAALIVRNSYYIANNHGYVAIYQGIHGEVFGLRISRLEESSDVEVHDLPEAIQDQIVQGIPMGSLEDAEAVIDDYRAQIEEDRARAQTIADEAIGAGATPAPSSTDAEGELQGPSVSSSVSGASSSGSSGSGDGQTVEDASTEDDASEDAGD